MSMSTEAKIADPVRLAVVQNALVGIAREMGTIMERASYSAILNEGKDFSCAVFNRTGELVAEGEFVLVHLAAMHEAVQVLIKKFESTWRPGDIAIHNDPYNGGSHLPDINIVRPVFADHDIIAYVAVRAHYPDVGGIVPGSFSGEAQNLFSEGVVIPPLLLARKDRLDDQLIELWSRNVRVARRLRADLMAQVAAVRVGERSLLALLNRYDTETVSGVLDEIPRYGEEIMRRRISERVSGGATLFDYMDDAGPETEPVRIELAVSADGTELVFDYRGSDEQVACPINAPVAVVKSATYGAVKCLLVPELPLNSGMFRPLKVLTTPGTVTNPLPPAPVAAGNTNTSQRIFDLCVACLGGLMGDGQLGMAGSYSANSDLGIGGHDPRTGDEFVLYMMPVGGIGARSTLDGESALINYMGNCSSQPAEVWEAMYPLRVREYRLRDDSGGPGRQRGGLGVRISYEALADNLEVSIFTERQRFAPFGLLRGEPASRGEYRIRRGDNWLEIPTKTSGLWLRTGDVIEISSGGGGGFGNPFERDPQRVAEDVLERFVSRRTATEHYGVEFDAQGNVDMEATMRRRATGGRQHVRDSEIRAIDESRRESILIGRDDLGDTTAVDGQVVCCASSQRSVYLRAVIGSGSGCEVSSATAEALLVGQGQPIQLQFLPTSWSPYPTDELRKTFKHHRQHERGSS